MEEGGKTPPDNQSTKIADMVFILTRIGIKKCQPTDLDLHLLLDKFECSLAEKDSNTVTTCERIVNLVYLAVSDSLPETVVRLCQLFASYVGQDKLKKMHENSCGMLRDTGIQALVRCHLPILRSLVATGLMDLKQHPDALFQCIRYFRLKTSVLDVISWLVSEQGFDPRILNADGVAPIHVAIREEDCAAVEALIMNGADVNSMARSDQMTPLHVLSNLYLRQLSRPFPSNLLELLLRHGADLSPKNNSGYTVVSVFFWMAAMRLSPREQKGRFLFASVEGGMRFPFTAEFIPSGELSDSDSEGESEAAGNNTEGESMDCEGDSETADTKEVLSALFNSDPAFTDFFIKLINNFGLGVLAMDPDILQEKDLWQHSKKTFQKAGVVWKHVPSLQMCCRTTVRRSIGGVHFQRKVDQLPVPDLLKHYLKEL